MKQVEVTILGQSYLLGCPDDGQEALLSAVAMVDREMSGIRDAGRVKARERIAVLAALNLAYRLAEAQAAPPPSVQSTGASLEPAPGATAGGTPAPTGAIDVESLVRRIDDLLAKDGQLL